MAQELIYSGIKSHYDKEADWNPAKSAAGMDTHLFTVPGNSRYARFSVDVEVASLASGYSVESAPEAGATGEQMIRVRWWYNSFGKIRYVLKVFAGEPETVTIWHGDNNWTANAIHSLQQGLDLTVAGRGRVAKKLFSRIRRMSPDTTEFHFNKAKGIHRTSVVENTALFLISTIKYGAIGGIILHALSRGYSISAEFNAGGPFPFDDLLKIDMTRQ